MSDFGRRAGVGDMLKSVYDPNEDGVIAVAQTEADMEKSVYDPGDDGLVDDAEKLEGSSKTQVQNHTPQTHGHVMSFIAGLLDALAGKSPTGHTHTEVEVTDLDHDAQKIKGVEVDDTDKGADKVLAYNDTSGKLEYETAAAGQRYVDRGDPSDWDWDKADLTEDHNWYDLDCGSIVPAGATAIMFRVMVKEDTTGRIFELREKGNSNDINAAVITINVANVQKDMCCVVACDADRKVEYRASSTVWTEIHVLVKGWFI